MTVVRPHKPPEYTGASTSSSPATTLHNGSSPDRYHDFARSQTHSTARSKSPSNLPSPAEEASPEQQQPSTAFVEPEKDALQRTGSRMMGMYPTVGQQMSQLARQSSACSENENRPPSPPFPHAALALSRSISAPGAIYIEWDEGDPQCPLYWSQRKKWLTTSVCVIFAACTALLATAYGSTGPQVEEAFNVSETIFLLGNTTYLAAVAFAPLVLAPFSELVGRKWIFNTSAFLTAVMIIPQALATNIYAIIFSRLIMGITASCGNSLVGGIISDIFPNGRERSLAMSTFALIIFVFQGVGPLCSSFTVQMYGWRVSFWWQMGVCFVPWIMMLLVFDETRGPVLLSKKAAQMTKETNGRVVYRCRADDEKTSVLQMIKTSVSRPIIYLTTEPIVMYFGVWIGFLWSTVFLSIGAVPIAFGTAYGWTQQQSSIVLLVLALGGCLGLVLNFWQEAVYARAVQRYNGEPPPEIRLYSCCIGAVIVPIGLFIYAWGAQSHVHPAVPIVGLVIFATGVFPIYLGVFVVLAGIYGRYASSALAAQSWLRNTGAAVSPLWTPAMYHNLGAPYATTILACIAAVLGTCPFVLLFFGPQLRARSRVAQAMQKEEEELEEQRRLEREKQERRKRRQEQKERMLSGEKPTPFARAAAQEANNDPERDIEKTAAALEQS